MDERRQQEIHDWINHSVTQDLKAFVEKAVEGNREALMDGNYYAPYEPNKTQENVARVTAALRAYETVLDYLRSAEAIEAVKEDLDE